jgi:hypothetical protein
MPASYAGYAASGTARTLGEFQRELTHDRQVSMQPDALNAAYLLKRPDSRSTAERPP